MSAFEPQVAQHRDVIALLEVLRDLFVRWSRPAPLRVRQGGHTQAEARPLREP